MSARKDVYKPSTIQANNPAKPRRKKLFRVSYYFPKEIDKVTQFAPLHYQEIMAFRADDAIRQVERSCRVIVSAYKYTPRPIKGRSRRIFLGERTAKKIRTTPTKVYYTRKHPNCKLCGEPNPKGLAYCSEECRREQKNALQIRSRTFRYYKALSEGRNPCKNCIIRNAETTSGYCNKCYTYKRKT